MWYKHVFFSFVLCNGINLYSKLDPTINIYIFKKKKKKRKQKDIPVLECLIYCSRRKQLFSGQRASCY